MTQLPVKAVISPRRTDTVETKNAMCIDTAFSEGLPMDNPPAPAIMTPKRRGISAVTYPVAAKNPIPRVPIIPPASTDNCGMLKPAMAYLDMTLDSRLNILYRVWKYND